jgi:hypothetical protein
MSILNTVANLLPEVARPLVLRVREFVCGQPVPDDAAPGTRVRDMTSTRRDAGEADPQNLAATGRAATQGELHQLARPDTYAETLALNERFEEQQQRTKPSANAYDYARSMAERERRERGRFAITDDDPFK